MYRIRTDDTNQEPVVKQWDRRSIPYDIGFTNKKHIAAIKSALELLERETCLNFRQRKKNDADYIHFTDLGGCWSYVGRNGGKQPVSLGTGCKTSGKVSHETMHALGFIHEHQREDRDEYIKVNYENIELKCGSDGKSSCQGNFSRAPAGLFPYPEVYDSNSVMHYDGYSFSKAPMLDNPTIVDRRSMLPVVAQRERPSVGDIKRICRLYGCDEEECGGSDVLQCGDQHQTSYWPSRKCDGRQDCPNRADETDCDFCRGDTSWQCSSTRQCIDKSQLCDGRRDCDDNSDESSCQSLCCGQYRIGSDTYIQIESNTVRGEWVHVESGRRLMYDDNVWRIADEQFTFAVSSSSAVCPGAKSVWFYWSDIYDNWRANLYSFECVAPVVNGVYTLLSETHLEQVNRDFVAKWSTTDNLVVIQSNEQMAKPRPLLASDGLLPNYIELGPVDMDITVQIVMLLESIPLVHSGCKIFVIVSDFVKLRVSDTPTIKSLLHEKNCYLIGKNVASRQRRDDFSFAEFEVIMDTMDEKEEVEKEYEATEDDAYEVLTRVITNLNGLMHNNDYQLGFCPSYGSQSCGSYDTSGAFVPHSTAKACTAESCCWDSDLNLCQCRNGSTSDSCYNEVEKLPGNLTPKQLQQTVLADEGGKKSKKKKNEKSGKVKKSKKSKKSKLVATTTTTTATTSTVLKTTTSATLTTLSPTSITTSSATTTSITTRITTTTVTVVTTTTSTKLATPTTSSSTSTRTIMTPGTIPANESKTTTATTTTSITIKTTTTSLTPTTTSGMSSTTISKTTSTAVIANTKVDLTVAKQLTNSSNLNMLPAQSSSHHVIRAPTTSSFNPSKLLSGSSSHFLASLADAMSASSNSDRPVVSCLACQNLRPGEQCTESVQCSSDSVCFVEARRRRHLTLLSYGYLVNYRRLVIYYFCYSVVNNAIRATRNMNSRWPGAERGDGRGVMPAVTRGTIVTILYSAFVNSFSM